MATFFIATYDTNRNRIAPMKPGDVAQLNGNLDTNGQFVVGNVRLSDAGGYLEVVNGTAPGGGGSGRQRIYAEGGSLKHVDNSGKVKNLTYPTGIQGKSWTLNEESLNLSNFSNSVIFNSADGTTLTQAQLVWDVTTNPSEKIFVMQGPLCLHANNSGGYLQMHEKTEASVPTPPANYAQLFYDSADNHLKVKDENNTVTDLFDLASELYSLDELSDVTTANSLSLATPPSYQWIFDEASFGTAEDTGRVGGYGLDTTLSSDPQSGTGPTGFGSEKAIEFDGNDSIGGTAEFPNKFENDFSLAFRINPGSIGATQFVMGLQQDDDDYPFAIQLESTGKISLYTFDINDTIKATTTTNTLTAGTWHWVFASYDRSTGTLKIQLDSDAPDTNSYAAGTQLRQHSGAKLYVGAYGITPTDHVSTGTKIAGLYLWDTLVPEAEWDLIEAANVENLAWRTSTEAVHHALMYNTATDEYSNVALRLSDSTDVDSTAPLKNQIIRWNGTLWEIVDNHPAEYTEYVDSAVPDTPAVGVGRVWKPIGNDGLFYIRDNNNAPVDLTRPQISADDITNITTDLVLSAPPINQWKFNESSFGTAVDTGTNADYDLDTPFGTITTDTGYPGFGAGIAAQFASDSDIKGSTAYPNRFTGDFSIAALVRRDTISNGIIACVCDGTANADRSFTCSFTSDQFRADVYNGSTPNFVNTTETYTDTAEWLWIFVTYVKSTGTLSIKVNDGTTYTSTFGGDTQINQHSTAAFMWGGFEPSRSGNDFKGSIDAGYVFDYALSEAEMASIYASGEQNTEDFRKAQNVALASGDILEYDATSSSFKHVPFTIPELSGLNGAPIHQYLFSESSFGTAYDTGSIGDYPLTPSGGTPTRTVGPAGFGDERAASVPAGAYFVGGSDFPRRFDGDFTIAARIALPASGTAQPHIINYNKDGSNQAIYLLVNRSTGAVSFWLSENGTTLRQNNTDSGVFTADDSFQWIFAKLDASTGDFTIRVEDGAGSKTKTVNNSNLVGGIHQMDHPLELLGAATNDDLDGRCAGLYIFDRLLTTSEEDAIYASGSATVKNLVASKETGAVYSYNKSTGRLENRQISLHDLVDTSADFKDPTNNYVPKYDSTTGLFELKEFQHDAEAKFVDIQQPTAPADGNGTLWKGVDNDGLLWMGDGPTVCDLTRPKIDIDEIQNVNTDLVLPAPPTHQYKLNEATFPTASDSGSGTAYDIDTTVLTAPTTAPGFPSFGGGLSAEFSGVGAIEGTGAFPDIFGADWSAAVLFKRKNTDEQGVLFSLYGDGGSSTHTTMLQLLSGGSLAAYAIENANQKTVSKSVNDTDQWHWAFVTYDYAGGVLGLRVDGGSLGTVAMGGSNVALNTPTEPLRIGSIGGTISAATADNVDAFIEALYFFEYKLETADMDSIYANGAQNTEDFLKSSTAALADGDVLQYEASTSTFKPAQIPEVKSENTVTTTDATVTTIATIPMQANGVAYIDATVVAKNGTTETNVYRFDIHADDAAGTATVVNATKAYENEEQANWDVTVTASGANVLIQVQGEAAKTVNWKSFHRVEDLV